MVTRALWWVLRKLGWPLLMRAARRVAVAVIPGVGLTLRLLARARKLLRLARLLRLVWMVLPVLLLPLRLAWWLARQFLP